MLRKVREDNFSKVGFQEEVDKFQKSTPAFKPWETYGTESGGKCKGVTTLKNHVKSINAELIKRLSAKGLNGEYLVKNTM